jgi:hypothetical protein
MSILNLRLRTWTWACEFARPGRNQADRCSTFLHLRAHVFRRLKASQMNLWEETRFGTSLTCFWKTPSHHSWEDLIRAFSRLKWSWERGTLLFVFLACLQSGTGKIPENISKFARRQFSRDRSFTKDLAGKLRVWFKFASGKSQKLTSKFHTFGNGCVAMLNYQRILYMCHNYGVYSPNMLNNGSVRSVSDQT